MVVSRAIKRDNMAMPYECLGQTSYSSFKQLDDFKECIFVKNVKTENRIVQGSC